MNWVIVGAVSGFLGVATGAFGAHGLKERLDAYSLGIWQTAVQYQMWHAAALVLVGLLARFAVSESTATVSSLAGWAFLMGTLLFSGSLYVLALSGIKWLGAVTPLGGVGFLVGWAALAMLGLRLGSPS